MTGLGFKLRGLCTALMCCAVLSGVAFADGNDTLGAPSITIKPGTGIVAAGTGTETTDSGTIDLTIPAGATIQQVLVYWHAAQQPLGAAGDDEITVDGISVQGTEIGFFDDVFGRGTMYSFRADITDKNIVTTGINSIDIADHTNNWLGGGVGIMVIIDEGDDGDILVKDGNDFAYVGHSKTADKQTFTFAAATSDRTAKLSLFVASVEGSDSGGGQRPNTIEVTVDGTVTEYINKLDSSDGQEWDTFITDVAIPAGVTSVSVQLFSDDRIPLNRNPASMNWITAGLSVPPAFTPDPSIDIRKQAEGADSRVFDIGDDVTFEIKVTNTGNVTLTDVEVTDELTPECDKYIGTLKAGESYTYECTVENLQAGYNNIACVEGTYDATDPDTVVKDCDPSEVKIPEQCCGKEVNLKPSELTFRYTGDDCDASNNTQEDGKWSCEDVVSGGPNDAATVTVCVKDKDGTTIFDEDVNLNDEFTIKGTKFDKKKGTYRFQADTYFVIKDSSTGAELQKIKIHTSCSQDLITGDQYGALEYTGCSSGSTTPPTGGDGDTVCSKDAKAVELTFTYTGGDCGDSSNSQDSTKAFCEDSNGSPIGVADVTLTITDKNGNELFSGVVNLNDEITIKGSKFDKKKNTYKFEADTFFEITKNGDTLQQGKFHTSCSQPLVLEDVFGALTLTGGKDANGKTYE